MCVCVCVGSVDVNRCMWGNDRDFALWRGGLRPVTEELRGRPPQPGFSGSFTRLSGELGGVNER